MKRLKRNNPQYHHAILLLLLSCFTPISEAQKSDLFEFLPVSESSASLTPNFENKAVHPIRLNERISENDVGDLVNLTLPNGRSLPVEINKKWTTDNGDVQLVGRFSGDGSAVITIGKNSVFANFNSLKHNYGIGLDINKQPFLIDHKAAGNTINLGDDMRFPEEGAARKHKAKKARNATADNKSIITLLAIYSPEFANGFSNNPVTRINQMIAFTNQAYERSGIHIEITLASAQKISFSNSDSTNNLLDQVTNGVNAFSTVPELRNEFSADMVAVLPFRNGNSVSGIAWINGDNARYSYSVSQFAVWGSDSVFAHELGHNMGSGHERIAVNSSQNFPCSGGYTGFSCGHGSGSRGTIMSYLDDASWGYVFSNPALSCRGQPCGASEGQTNSADNRRSFNITGPLVEKFRGGSNNAYLMPIYPLLLE